MASEEEKESEPEVESRPIKKPNRHMESVNLNITSLMDAISIILCYLLVSINSDPWNVKQNQFLTLAKSTAETEPRESMAIVVNRREILVDNTRAVPIECTTSEAKGARQCRSDEDFAQPDNKYVIDKMYKEDGSEMSFKVTALATVLQEKLEASRELHALKGSSETFRAQATVICDRSIPYRIVAELVNTMGQTGIENIRFAVMQGERWTP